MNTTFNPAYKTGENDLLIQVVDDNDNPIDPYEITYSIYRILGPRSSQELVSDLDLIPIRKSLGIFFPEYQIPSDFSFGKYVIKWNIKKTSSSLLTQVQQEFAIIIYPLETC